MAVPKRIQRRRTAGWRMPEGAIYVGRPSKFGNPFTVQGAIEHGYADTTEEGRAVAAEAFRDWLHGDMWAAGEGPEWNDRRLRMLADLNELAGRDLVCWCPISSPCHADSLIAMANGEVADGRS